MLLIWFGIVLALSLILVFAGYSLSQPPLAISGAVLLFLLGSVVMFSNIEVKAGYTEISIAPCNNNCSEVREGGDVYLAEITNKNVSYNYAPIIEEEVVGVGINHLLGFFLVLIGVFVFIDVLFSLRGLK
jgi:hypothetical protein